MFSGCKNDSGLWSSCTGLKDFCSSSSRYGSRKPLIMPELKQQNQLTGDALRSLPSSPGSDYEEIDDCSSACTALDVDTREIIDTFFRIFSGLPHSTSGRKKVLSTIERVVDSLAVKHELVYKGMITRLKLDERGDNVSFVHSVAKDLFSDGTTNWGRIASLLTFGAILCKHQNERGLSNYVGLVGEEISSYLLTAQRDWLLKNKAWDGFVEFFNVPDTEAAVRNALITIGSLATFSAAIVYWIR